MLINPSTAVQRSTLQGVSGQAEQYRYSSAELDRIKRLDNVGTLGGADACVAWSLDIYSAAATDFSAR